MFLSERLKRTPCDSEMYRLVVSSPSYVAKKICPSLASTTITS